MKMGKASVTICDYLMTGNDIKKKILGFFRKNAGNYVSGEEMGNALGVSRACVWKYINKLRDDGHVVDAVPRLGYRLKSAPDKLFGYEIKTGLKTRVMGKKEIYYHESIGSTNDLAYKLAEVGKGEGTLVVAESQSRGKGRMGRSWVSPKGGGIYMSLILRPDVETDEVPSITLIAAKSITRIINKITGIDAKIKWPNDIVIDGKKVCGILTEIKAHPDRADFLILGIGINVNTPAEKLPPAGTSLKNETHFFVNRAQLLRDTLEGFEKDYYVFKKEGFSSLREECKKLSLILKKKVKITEHHRTIRGTAVDIDEKGALIIKDEKGALRRVFSGDVTMIGT